MAGLRLNRERHIFDRAEAEKELGNLKRPRQPERAAPVCGSPRNIATRELYSARIGKRLTGDLVNERRFSRAIGSDDGMEFAGADIERKPVRSYNSRKRFAQRRDFEQWPVLRWSPGFHFPLINAYASKRGRRQFVPQ